MFHAISTPEDLVVQQRVETTKLITRKMGRQPKVESEMENSHDSLDVAIAIAFLPRVALHILLGLFSHVGNMTQTAVTVGT